MFDNIVDIHSHTLWGLDDGARRFEETMDMCFCAEDNGTSILFVTPHLMYWDTAEDLFDKRNEKIEALNNELEYNDSQLVIKPGFEILCDDEIFSVKHFYPYTLNQSRYILIEFSFEKTTESDVTAWCDYLKSFGLVPVIAHPERYRFVQTDVCSLNRLSDRGVLFQINAGSPAGMFGPEEKYVSDKMLECGFVDFLGSDAHRINIRNTDIAECIHRYDDNIDLEELEKIATKNPEFIINDGIYVPKRKKYLEK